MAGFGRRKGLWWLVFWALALGSAGPEARAAEGVVTDVRVGQHGSTTRLVFDIDRRVEFKVFALEAPYRVVIDLPELGWRLPARPLPVDIGILGKLRYGLFQPGVTRVVLDVKAPPLIEKSFLLAPSADAPYRLVVDLAATAAQAFKSGPGAGVGAATGKAAPVALVVPETAPQAMPSAPAKRTVVIDPGHGGVDPGTIGTSGTYEKHITLAMARELKRQLEKNGDFIVFLTRERDIFVPLRDRVGRARERGAELFVSIHADAIKNGKTRGLSVYTLSEKASDKEAAALAEKENKADLLAGINLSGETPEVTNILIDLAQRESMNQSARFATGLVKQLRRETKILRNTHRFAGFAVLKAPDVPSVLIELGFLSNRSDEKALQNKAYRAKLAAGIVRAVDGYFSNIEEAYKK